ADQANFQNVTTAGNLDISSDLRVTGRFELGAKATLQDVLEVQGVSNLSTVQVGSELTVVGGTILQGGLDVIGQAVLQDNLTLRKDLLVYGNSVFANYADFRRGVLLGGNVADQITVLGNLYSPNHAEFRHASILSGNLDDTVIGALTPSSARFTTVNVIG
ncbi:MAG: hypothetical protein HQL31_07420, partial [Planctomycetes bacterium]|nr:hypothetical protein [Planctomycetota bacterium]